ncbi:MAG: hypothetical protein Q4A78_01790 [Peptostreptococcaceae bacterium]|nr:hypothetical protein [Peptostreptococcaceae bacterium]
MHKIALWKMALIHALAWTLFSIGDYMEEQGMDLDERITTFGLPIAVFCGYIFYDLVFGEKKDFLWREAFSFIGKFFVSGIGFFLIINELVSAESWIVKQGSFFLNGIEYGIFGIFLMGGCTLAFLIYYILRWIGEWIAKKMR